MSRRRSQLPITGGVVLLLTALPAFALAVPSETTPTESHTARPTEAPTGAFPDTTAPALPGQFVAGPSMVADRASHTATLLPDGRVLIVGGYGDAVATLTEVWDPTTNSFQASAEPEQRRYYHSATLLGDGSVAIIGGGEDSSSPSIDRWTADGIARAGTLAVPRSIHTATLLVDGSVLVVGGYDPSARAPAERWDPATGLATPAGSLAAGRAWHTATRLSDGRVLIVGGSAQAELWDATTQSFSPAGVLPEARWWPSATLLGDDSVLIVGGGVGEAFPGTGDVLASALLWSPATMTFSPAGTLAQARFLHAATLLPDGRVLVLGGGNPLSGPPLDTSELWSPATMSFTQGPSLGTGRYKPTATLLGDGRVLVVGGDAASATLRSTEIWVP